MLVQILGLCFFVASAARAQNCHQDWLYHEESCYGYGEYPLTWAEAQVMCISFDSKLVEIETAAENTFLKSMATSKNGAFYWIGATDIFHEGVWEWVSTRETIVDYTDWAPGAPSDSATGQDCLAFDKRYGYQWNDAECEGKFDFICEARPLEEPVVG